MSKPCFTGLVVAAMTLVGRGAIASEQAVRLNPRLAEYIEVRIREFDEIPNERKARLEELARYVQSRKSDDKLTKLIFICTHNSRRSHMAQLWAAAAAARYGFDAVETYSGGTESTAFNPRAIEALERAGFRFVKDGTVT